MALQSVLGDEPTAEAIPWIDHESIKCCRGTAVTGARLRQGTWEVLATAATAVSGGSSLSGVTGGKLGEGELVGFLPVANGGLKSVAGFLKFASQFSNFFTGGL